MAHPRKFDPKNALIAKLRALGAKGWVGVRLTTRGGWKELKALLTEAHAMSAPAKLRKQLIGAKQEAKRSPL